MVMCGRGRDRWHPVKSFLLLSHLVFGLHFSRVHDVYIPHFFAALSFDFMHISTDIAFLAPEMNMEWAMCWLLQMAIKILKVKNLEKSRNP